MNAPIDNPVFQFANVLKAHGLDVTHVIDDGAIHKCKCEHDKGNKTSGRYYFHSDGLSNGEFGCYHEDENALGNKWTADTVDTRTDAQKAEARKQYAIKAAEREAQLLAEQAEAATQCKELWIKANEASNAHGYLTAKGVNAYGIKELNGALLVPLYDGKNQAANLVNVQFIQTDGTKRFKTGGKKQGCYFAFGSTDTKTAVICEGYSTGASIAQATGHYVVVAFDAGNLLPVAQRIKDNLPDGWRVIIAADNDQWKGSNTGRMKGAAAALAIDAPMCSPCFDGLDTSNHPTDFNDLHQLAGLDAIKAAFDDSQNLIKLNIELLAAIESENLIKPDIQIIAEETDEDFIKRLARFTPLEFARQKKGAAERLGIAQADLKALVKEAQSHDTSKREAGTQLLFEDIEPWESPVNGADVLNEIVGQLRLHVITDPETLDAAALWVCMTWLVDFASVLPLAMITAPEKGCGKSTLLTAMAKMAFKPLQASNTTAAATFRAIEAIQPTLFIDEADTFLKDNEDMRCIINSGHTRDSAYVMRTVGEDFETKTFSTWCAKAVCGIGRLPETIESRSIILKMRRKLKGEHANNIRHAKPETFTAIKRKLARWTEDNAAAFADLCPIMEGLSNRDADNYEPLLAIAMLAGGGWVERITAAAKVLTAHSDENKSIGIELLEACKVVFETQYIDKIKSTDLLNELLKDEEAPFLTYNRGKPLTVKQMSKRLADYGIKSKDMRFSFDGVRKGFEKTQFDDAFSIYLAKEGDFAATSLQTSKDGALGVAAKKVLRDNIATFTHDTENVTLRSVTCYKSVTPEAAPVLQCNDVTLETGKNDENFNSVDDWLSNYDNAAQNQNFSAAPKANDGGKSWVL